jgi:hypothetical protein
VTSSTVSSPLAPVTPPSPIPEGPKSHSMSPLFSTLEPVTISSPTPEGPIATAMSPMSTPPSSPSYSAKATTPTTATTPTSEGGDDWETNLAQPDSLVDEVGNSTLRHSTAQHSMCPRQRLAAIAVLPAVTCVLALYAPTAVAAT